MKRLFLISFTALALGAFSAGALPSTAFAGLCDQVPALTGQALADCLVSEAGANATYDETVIQASNQAALEAAAKTTTDLKPSSDDTYDTIMMKIMSLFAWLVGVAAMTLDYSVYYTVVVMGSYISGISAIGLTWEVLRDIGNIILIFGFLAIGISVILNTERLGYGKKMLPMLLVAAVFMNFSLFFAEAIIDTGNLFATQFYKQINGGQLPQTLPGSSVLANPAGTGALTPGTEAISNKLMSQLGLQAIYGNASDPTKAQTLLKAGSPWYVGFLGILLFIITAFVMFSLAFILIARFVILIFLIILSPIGFAGLAVPKLASTAHKWWSTLFQQTITAPVLLLMLYIALRVITDVKFLSGLGVIDASAATGVIGGTNLPGFAGWILSFLVAMGLLIAVTITAKSISAFGAGAAMKGAGALSFGATAWAGRFGVGTVVGRGVLGNRFIKKGAVSNNKLIKYGSRALAFTGNRLQNRTFDIRNAPGATAGLSALNINAGTPSKLTAKQLQEKQYGLKPTMEWFRNASKEYEKNAAELDKKKAISDPTHPDFEKTLKKMGVDELAELRGIRKGLAPYVKTLSPAKYSELQKSDKLLQVEKDNLKTAWNNQFNPANAAATMSRFSTEEISALDADTLKKPDVVAALGPTEFDAIRRKGNLTKADRTAMHAEMFHAAAINPAYMAAYTDYFLPANDPGGSRDKYWR